MRQDETKSVKVEERARAGEGERRRAARRGNEGGESKGEIGRENLLKESIFAGWEKNNHGNSIRRKPRPEAGQKRYQ